MPHFGKCLFLPDYGLFGRRGVRRDTISLSRVRVRVIFTTGAVRSAILATAGLLVFFQENLCLLLPRCFLHILAHMSLVYDFE